MKPPKDDNLFLDARENYLDETFPGDLGKLVTANQPDLATPETNAPGWVSVVLAASLLLTTSLALVLWSKKSDAPVATSNTETSNRAAVVKLRGSRLGISGGVRISKTALASAPKRRTTNRTTSMAVFSPARKSNSASSPPRRSNVTSNAASVRLDKTVRLEPVFKGQYRSSNAQSKKMAKSWQRWQKLKSRTRPAHKITYKSKRRS